MCSRWRGEHRSSKGNPKKFPIPLLLNFKNASLLIHLSLNSDIMHKSISPEHEVLNSREIENPDGRKWKLSQKIPQLISPKKLWIPALLTADSWLQGLLRTWLICMQFFSLPEDHVFYINPIAKV